MMRIDNVTKLQCSVEIQFNTSLKPASRKVIFGQESYCILPNHATTFYFSFIISMLTIATLYVQKPCINNLSFLGKLENVIIPIAILPWTVPYEQPDHGNDYATGQ